MCVPAQGGAHMSVIRTNSLQPCTRCEGKLLLAATTPPRLGSLLLELCPACDAEKLAAGAFIRWVLAGEGKKEMTPERVAEMARLHEAWLHEVMGEHGWFQMDAPAPSVN